MPAGCSYCAVPEQCDDGAAPAQLLSPSLCISVFLDVYILHRHVYVYLCVNTAVSLALFAGRVELCSCSSALSGSSSVLQRQQCPAGEL